MKKDDIELPPLPVPRTKTDGGIELFAEYSVREYARAAIEPYKQRIAELESELQELHRQWVEHDTLGCPTAKTGIYASEAALQSQDQVDAERYRCLSSMATQQADALGPIFRIDVRRTPQTLFNFDAAVDHARRIERES